MSVVLFSVKISRISVDLDTDQETWSVRFPHDKKKSWQKMERWNIMVSSKENEQSENHKNCETQKNTTESLCIFTDN